MYSNKKNVQLLVAALEAYKIKHIVLSPGSRNAPLIHTLANHLFFNCRSVVDERSAAYVALGIIQKEREPVVVCCTSGTALLNYAPAIAEAYYQQLPLIVISADRSPAWIGQMDGQTIPQSSLFHAITKKSVQLPEISTEEERWYCLRLIHEALLASGERGKGPVHINIPISEPLFDFSVTELPVVQPIQLLTARQANQQAYIERWHKSKKRMLVIGQLEQNNPIKHLIEILVKRFDFVVLAEHLSNIPDELLISNFDEVLHVLKEENSINYIPDLLISFGGHIVSKRLKHFLRKNKIESHWHIAEDGNLVDLFQSLTDLLQIAPIELLEALVHSSLPHEHEKPYRQLWNKQSIQIKEPEPGMEFSDLDVVKCFLEHLPSDSALHLGNSSTVRHVQLFGIDSSIQVFCNRGTNGIDGAISTAVGYAGQSEQLTFLIVGDLSFFYDLNALCYNNMPCNLRVLLLNNGGGAIFSHLPVPNKTESFYRYVAAEHNEKAGKWISKEDICYMSASSTEELNENIIKFVSKDSEKPMVLEVFTKGTDTRG